MKSCQMAAGIVPPYTGDTPCTLSIGISPSGYPTHTHVASCGVYPQNHASTYSCAVPVLPATGRSDRAAALPVPDVTTSSSAYVTRSASFGSRTCCPLRLTLSTTLPLWFVSCTSGFA